MINFNSLYQVNRVTTIHGAWRVGEVVEERECLSLPFPYNANYVTSKFYQPIEHKNNMCKQILCFLRKGIPIFIIKLKMSRGQVAYFRGKT